MHPNQEGQSLHLVTELYQKYKKLLKEMLGIQDLIHMNSWHLTIQGSLHSKDYL